MIDEGDGSAADADAIAGGDNDCADNKQAINHATARRTESRLKIEVYRVDDFIFLEGCDMRFDKSQHHASS